MDKLRKKLLFTAISRFGNIQPTTSKSTLSKCFSMEGSKLIFWFNDEGGNTRVIREDQLEVDDRV